MDSNNPQIIIPMSGIGSRFKKAGYNNIKPLITLANKPIIEYVTKLFSPESNIKFICNKDHLNTTNLKKVLGKPNHEIIPVTPAKKGPVHAIQQAYESIDDSRPVIVSYCDFYQTWNYQHFLDYVTQNNCDGAVVCYKGFHPHLLHEKNIYASCKVGKNDKLLDIKEKYSFSQNKQHSPQSGGIYYFKTGKILKKYCDKLMQNGPTVANEYYVSLTYMHMLDDNLDVRVYDKVDYFCQWGTPQDLEEYLYWYEILNNKVTTNNDVICQQQLIPAAGAGSRFQKEGYRLPKPLIPVANKPMLSQAISALPQSKKTILVCQKMHADQYDLQRKIATHIPGATIVTVPKLSQGQAMSALAAESYLDPKQDLIIGACDNGMLYNKDLLVKTMQEADCIVFTFRNNPTVTHKPEQYGWVKLADNYGNIAKVSVKIPISCNPIKDHAIAGTFWFKNAGIFLKAADNMIKAKRTIGGEFYIDELINDVITLGFSAKVFEIDYYIGWGTPNDLKIYEYWRSFFAK